MNINVSRLICANTQDEGFGSVYERIMLEELLKRLHDKYGFKTILEYGCRFTKGYDDLVFMKENCEVTLGVQDVDKIRDKWKFDLKPEFSDIDDIDTEYDLVWNFAIIQLNPHILMKMKEASRRYVLFFTPNVWNYGTAFHITYHLISRTECHHPEQGKIRLRSRRGLKRIATENGLTVLESGYVDIPWWLSASIATQHLPMYQFDTRLGMRYSIAEAGFLTSHYATKNSPTVTLLPFNLYLKTAWYSTYDMYKIARSRAKPGVYPDEWRSYGVKELSLASFKWENISHPLFYIPVGLSLLSAVYNVKDSDCSIFKKNKAYIDGDEMPMGQALPMVIGINTLNYITTAIGEEALYRGVIYEELKVSFGSKRAKLFDFFIFPGIHVPMDIAAGRDAEYITKQFIIRGVSTLLFDFAYDKGGLPLSVALHTWFNLIGFTSRWMADGGTPDPCPEEENGTSVSVMPPLMISYSIRF